MVTGLATAAGIALGLVIPGWAGGARWYTRLFAGVLMGLGGAFLLVWLSLGFDALVPGGSVSGADAAARLGPITLSILFAGLCSGLYRLAQQRREVGSAGPQAWATLVLPVTALVLLVGWIAVMVVSRQA